MASRDPAGMARVDGLGNDREDAGAGSRQSMQFTFSPRRRAVTPWRDRRLFGHRVVGPEPGPRLREDAVGPLRLSLVEEQRGLHERQDDPALVGQVRIGERPVQFFDVAIADAAECRGDLGQGSVPRPGLEHRQDHVESAGVDRLPRLVGWPSAGRADGCGAGPDCERSQAERGSQEREAGASFAIRPPRRRTGVAGPWISSRPGRGDPAGRAMASSTGAGPSRSPGAYDEGPACAGHLVHPTSSIRPRLGLRETVEVDRSDAELVGARPSARSSLRARSRGPC